MVLFNLVQLAQHKKEKIFLVIFCFFVLFVVCLKNFSLEFYDDVRMNERNDECQN